MYRNFFWSDRNGRIYVTTIYMYACVWNFKGKKSYVIPKTSWQKYKYGSVSEVERAMVDFVFVTFFFHSMTYIIVIKIIIIMYIYFYFYFFYCYFLPLPPYGNQLSDSFRWWNRIHIYIYIYTYKKYKKKTIYIHILKASNVLGINLMYNNI